MAEKSKGQALLENAYKLATPEDNRRYYDAFAESYDADFAAALGYHYPKAVAAIYRAHATGADVPIADIGCGTGMVAAALGVARGDIDGVDISDAMLAQAAGKGLYRATIRADLTGPLDALGNGYGAVVSAGTFTSGHLGPEPLAGLLRIARPGALFVIGVNRVFFEAAGFGPVLERLQARGEIAAMQVIETAIYDGAGHAHSADKANVLCFRAAGRAA